MAETSVPRRTTGRSRWATRQGPGWSGHIVVGALRRRQAPARKIGTILPFRLTGAITAVPNVGPASPPGEATAATGMDGAHESSAQEWGQPTWKDRDGYAQNGWRGHPTLAVQPVTPARRKLVCCQEIARAGMLRRIPATLRLSRGAARIRTGDGGFAIRCLSHLATAPIDSRGRPGNPQSSQRMAIRWLLFGRPVESGIGIGWPGRVGPLKNCAGAGRPTSQPSPRLTILPCSPACSAAALDGQAPWDPRYPKVGTTTVLTRQTVTGRAVRRRPKASRALATTAGNHITFRVGGKEAAQRKDQCAAIRNAPR